MADFEVLEGKIRFEYKKGSEHKVPDSLSHYPVGSPDDFRSEEEKWIAAKVKLVAVDPPELTQLDQQRWKKLSAVVEV